MMEHKLDHSLYKYLVVSPPLNREIIVYKRTKGLRYLKVRLLKDFGKLSNRSIFLWQVVEGIQDLCDQLNIIVPHSL